MLAFFPVVSYVRILRGRESDCDLPPLRRAQVYITLADDSDSMVISYSFSGKQRNMSRAKDEALEVRHRLVLPSGCLEHPLKQPPPGACRSA